MYYIKITFTKSSYEKNWKLQWWWLEFFKTFGSVFKSVWEKRKQENLFPPKYLESKFWKCLLFYQNKYVAYIYHKDRISANVLLGLLNFSSQGKWFKYVNLLSSIIIIYNLETLSLA